MLISFTSRLKIYSRLKVSDTHRVDHYGKDVELGVGTSFEMVLAAMNLGTVFYDPRIKLEQVSSLKPKLKRRSQFRTNHKDLRSLYKQFDFVDVEAT